MATQIWRGGNALNVRQVADLQITNDGTNYAQGDTITLTIGNSTFVVTIGTLVTKAQVATTVYQAFMGLTLTDTSASASISTSDTGAQAAGQFAEITATNGTSEHVTFTANGSGPLAGKPFTMSASASSTHGTLTYTNASTASAGQYHGDSASNWSGNAGPEDSDTVIFDGGAFDWRWGLNTYASGPATSNPTTITKFKSYSGNVGLAYVNADSSSKTYPEYRTRYFTTDAGATANCTATLEIGDGPGSGRFMWDAGSGQSTVTVVGRGTRIDSGVPCILWKGTNASNVFSNLGGDCGLAFFGGETATIATVTTGDGPQSQASTICGSGCTLTTVKVNGGYQRTGSAITTATQYAGTWEHMSGTVTTLNQYGGTFIPRAAVTITSSTIYGTVDLSKCAGTVTFTNLVQLYGTINDPNGKAVFSAGWKRNSSAAQVIRPNGDTVSFS